jgi:hypothetical protein
LALLRPPLQGEEATMQRSFKIPIKFDPGQVMYLRIDDLLTHTHAELLRTPATEKFFEMVRQQVINQLSGTAVPQEISPAVMNIADDIAEGREVSIRAGDYISLMSYARANKMI